MGTSVEMFAVVIFLIGCTCAVDSEYTKIIFLAFRYKSLFINFSHKIPLRSRSLAFFLLHYFHMISRCNKNKFGFI